MRRRTALPEALAWSAPLAQVLHPNIGELYHEFGHRLFPADPWADSASCAIHASCGHVSVWHESNPSRQADNCMQTIVQGWGGSLMCGSFFTIRCQAASR
jgi:hypothetical protein